MACPGKDMEAGRWLNYL